MRVVLCEFASVDAEGIYTILRGGVERIVIVRGANALLWTFVELDGNKLPAGEAKAVVELHADGNPAPLVAMTGTFTVGDPTKPTRLSVPIQVPGVREECTLKIRVAVGEHATVVPFAVSFQR